MKVGETRREFLRGIWRFAVLFAMAAFLAQCYSTQSAVRLRGGPPARVIWIAIDSLRADHMGAAGYERDTSPWMDLLAGKSAVFEWAVAPAHATLPSVAGYFTSRGVTQNGGDPNVNRIPDEIVTLAEALSAAGMRCLAFTANPGIRPDRGYAQGFEDYRVITSPGKVLATIDEITADIRANYTQSRKREFIYIHTMDVHYPYRPPYPFGRMFTPPYTGNAVIEGDVLIETRRYQARSLHPFWSQLHNLSQEDIDFLVGLYDSAIRYTDAQLPTLLAALRWNPRRDLLILSADHGEALYEHGWWGHFASLTPTEIHVPLIMHYNGVTPARHATPVSLMDLYPTITEMYGLSLPEGIRGTSILPALAGGAVTPHDVYSESALQNGANAALVSGDLWYILVGNRSQHQPWHPWPYEEYLFEYRQDPHGRTNLLNDELEAANDLNARLRAFNPRWAGYTPENIRGGDERALLGEDVLRPESSSPIAMPRITEVNDGTWQAEVPLSELALTAEALTPYEPLFLEMTYSLEAGRIHLSLAPAEYRWPGTGKALEVWEHVCAKPGADQKLAATVVPIRDSARLVITLLPGTRARFETPTLRRMNFKRVEEWPHAPPGDISYTGLSPEELQRLKAIGYL